jgi:transcriptional regulator with XRE-family HTH domain
MNNNLIDLNAIQEEKVAFCKKLKAKRLSLNYTQEYMADLLNINVKTYRQIETCHKIANFETIKGLMTFLGFDDAQPETFDEAQPENFGNAQPESFDGAQPENFDGAQLKSLEADKSEKLDFTEDKDVDYSKVDDLDFKKMGN